MSEIRRNNAFRRRRRRLCPRKVVFVFALAYFSDLHKKREFFSASERRVASQITKQLFSHVRTVFQLRSPSSVFGRENQSTPPIARTSAADVCFASRLCLLLQLVGRKCDTFCMICQAGKFHCSTEKTVSTLFCCVASNEPPPIQLR